MRLKRHKTPLIIEGMTIPQKYMKGLHKRTVKRGDTEYVYYSYRLTGRRINTDTLKDFYESLDLAKKSDALPADTIDRLIDSYFKSDFFIKKSLNTQNAYTSWFKPIRQVFGQAEVKIMECPSIKHKALELRDALSDTPATAKQVITVLSILADYAIEKRKIHINHIRNIKLSYKSESRAENIFTDEQINNLLDYSFHKVKNKYLYNLIKLALFTAQRQKDLMNMKWSDIKDGFIHITQQKTKKRVFIPIHGQLQDFLDSLPKKDDYVLGYLKAFPRRYWSKALQEIGLQQEDYHFHDLRGTSITRMMESGADNQSIEMIAGNSSVIQKYLARNPKLVKKFTTDNLYDLHQPNVQQIVQQNKKTA